ARENPRELQHAAFVEHDRVEIFGLDPAVLQAPLDRAKRKARVVLAPRQPLFLYRRDRHAVDDKRRGGVVVVRRDAKDLHVSTGLSASPRGPPKPAASRQAPGARRAWRPTQTAQGRQSRYR